MNLMTVFLQAPAAAPGGGSMMWILLIAMFAIMYFFMIRPQNKKQKEMISLLEEQFQVTKGIKWDKASIDRTAQRILKQYDSTYSVQDLS